MRRRKRRKRRRKGGQEGDREQAGKGERGDVKQC